ncbi:MAG TPA: hypothetical protein VEH10_05780 [Thermoplasmata archaeon]|nr:hypothetical protein [Thermoplasmata archaeon]
MRRRALFSLINLGVAAAAIVVLFVFPRYAGYAIYGFLGWFVVSLSTVWFARGTPQAAGPSPPAAAPAGGAAPLASTARPATGRPAAPPAIGFCIYCASDLAPDAVQCPSCGHAVKRVD